MLTQKCMGYLSTATVLLDFSALADGQRGGLFCTGSLYNGIGISREEGKNYLYLEKNGDVQQVKMVSGKKIYLRVMLDAKKNRCQLFYSFDNCNFYFMWRCLFVKVRRLERCACGLVFI